jgi:hypothetical protein
VQHQLPLPCCSAPRPFGDSALHSMQVGRLLPRQQQGCTAAVAAEGDEGRYLGGIPGVAGYLVGLRRSISVKRGACERGSMFSVRGMGVNSVRLMWQGGILNGFWSEVAGEKFLGGGGVQLVRAEEVCERW